MNKNIRIMRDVLLIGFVVCIGALVSFSEEGYKNENTENVLSARDDFLRGRYDSAEKKIRKEIESDPRSFRANLLLGAIIGKIPGREEEALASYLTAVDIDANHPGLYGEMAALYDRLGMEDDIIRILTRGVETFPKNSSLNHSLGLAYFMKKNDAEMAAKYFTIALEAQPDNPKLIYITGLSEIIKGDIARALGYITKLREIKNEGLASRLEDVIRERYKGMGVDISGNVDDYINAETKNTPVSVSESETDPESDNPRKEEVKIKVAPGTTTVKGSGTVGVKQTYQYEDI